MIKMQESDIIYNVMRKAEKSFIREMQFLKAINMENGPLKLPTTLEGLWSIFQNDGKGTMTLDQFQARMRACVFNNKGKGNYEWLLYLSNKGFVDKIIKTGDLKMQEYVRLSGRKAEYLQQSEITSKKPGGNEYVLNPVFLRTRLLEMSKDMGKELIESFKKDVKKNGMKQNDVFFKQFSQDLLANLDIAFLTHQYTVRSRRKNMSTGKMENVKETSQQLFMISANQDPKKGKLEVFCTTDANGVSFLEDMNFFSFTREDSYKIIQDAFDKTICQKIKDENGLDTSRYKYKDLKRILSFTVDKSEFIRQAEGQRVSLSNLSLANLEKLASIFLGVVRQSLEKFRQRKGDVITESYQEIDKLKMPMARILQAQPHLIDKIFKDTTNYKATSGTIGEVMFGVMIQAIINDGAGEQVRIVGQNKSNSGKDAAVDVVLSKLVDGELKLFGFQIKNYTNIGTFTFNDSHGKFYNEEYMGRYLNDAKRAVLYELANRLWLYRKQPEWWVNETVLEKDYIYGGDRIAEHMLELLYSNINSFLRYDQCDMDEYIGVNDFYVVGFNFIPASIIFYAFAQALQKTDQVLQLKDFYFSYGNMDKNPNLPLLKTWDNSWRRMAETFASLGHASPQDVQNFLTPYTGQDGDPPPNKWKENLMLNYSSVKFNFKEKLEVLLKHMQK